MSQLKEKVWLIVKYINLTTKRAKITIVIMEAIKIWAITKDLSLSRKALVKIGTKLWIKVRRLTLHMSRTIAEATIITIKVPTDTSNTKPIKCKIKTEVSINIGRKNFQVEKEEVSKYKHLRWEIPIIKITQTWKIVKYNKIHLVTAKDLNPLICRISLHQMQENNTTIIWTNKMVWIHQ